MFFLGIPFEPPLAGIIATAQDLHNDQQLKHQGHFKLLNHTEIGEVQFDNPPFRFSKTTCEVRKSSPCMGEHNENICKYILGMSDEEYDELIQNDVLK